MNSKKISHKKAFAFSITLWIIASLLFATVVILRFAKDEVGLSRGLNDKLQTQLIAQSLLASLKFYVPTANYTSTSLKNNLLTHTEYPLPSEIIVDGREYNITKEIAISLRDSSSMFNVLYEPSISIAYLLSSKKDEELVSVLKDSLEDWRDEDNVARVNGAEQSSYLSLDKKTVVRDTQAIQDIHELKLIRGFENIEMAKIQENLFYGRGVTANLMLIDNQRYLSYILGVDENFMQDMLELRKDEPLAFEKRVYLLPHYDDDYVGFWLSKQFLIKIKVKQGRAITLINAMISFNKLKNRPYMTISYTMN